MKGWRKMIWVTKEFIVHRQERKDGINEFVVSRGNKVIDTIIPNSVQEEEEIRDMLDRGVDLNTLLNRIKPISKEKNDIQVGEIVEVKKPSLLLLHFIPFNEFHYLNSHGGKVGEVMQIIKDGNNRIIFEIRINEQEESIFIPEDHIKVVENEYVRRVYKNEKRKLSNNKGSS